MKLERIAVLGGSGFVGRHIVRLLSQRGKRVVVPTRRRERAKHIFMLPTVEVVQTDICEPAQLSAVLRGCDAAINLVGVLQSRPGEPYGVDFRRVHSELPRMLVTACEQLRIPRVLHMSALNASNKGPSAYLRSKGDGENWMFAEGRRLATTVFRPSVVFGPDDRFLNTFAALQRFLPLLPLACPDAKFQPVYVEDVALAFVHALEDRASFGRTYDLCGPRVYTLRDLVHYAGRVSGHARPVIGLSPKYSMLQAWLMEWLPGKLMSRDNVLSMSQDSVSAAAFPFGMRPAAIEAVVPGYMRGTGARARFDLLRARAGRG